jgi:hypothetical protein
MVWERFPNMPDAPGGRIPATHYSYLAWQRQNIVFSEMAAFRNDSLNETGIERPDHVDTGFASANLLPLLGVRARIGRLVLFLIPAHDPLTLAAAAIAILVVSPVALYVPLRRATAVDCTVALREE